MSPISGLRRTGRRGTLSWSLSVATQYRGEARCAIPSSAHCRPPCTADSPNSPSHRRANRAPGEIRTSPAWLTHCAACSPSIASILAAGVPPAAPGNLGFGSGGAHRLRAVPTSRSSCGSARNWRTPTHWNSPYAGTAGASRGRTTPADQRELPPSGYGTTRSRPSCTTVAISVPSRPKNRPVASPRPPDAVGEPLS